MNNYDDTINAIRDAAHELRISGWDWNEDFADAEGVRHVIDGPGEIDSLPDDTAKDAARSYTDQIDSLFQAAAQAADDAADALESGSVEEAVEELRSASRLEGEAGDDVIVRPVLKLVQSLLDEE